MEMSPWTILVIGMGTVFAALVLLALGLSVLRVVSTRKGSSKAGKVSAKAGSAPSSAGAPQASSGEQVGGAIVAAIVAAISAASGTPASAFRIASIERTGISTPVWGHVDRMARSPRGR